MHRARVLFTIKLIKLYKANNMKAYDSVEMRKPASVVLQIPKNCLKLANELYCSQGGNITPGASLETNDS
jgi:hypothetical protein